MKLKVIEVVPTPPPKTYQLELNEDEMKYIKGLAARSTQAGVEVAGRLFKKIPIATYFNFNSDNCFKDE